MLGGKAMFQQASQRGSELTSVSEDVCVGVSTSKSALWGDFLYFVSSTHIYRL